MSAVGGGRAGLSPAQRDFFNELMNSVLGVD